MIGAAASMPTILEFVGIQEECNPTTTLVAPSSPPLAAFSRANTHSSAFAQHALVGGNDSAPLPPLNPLATRSGALDTPVGSITTPSLAAAIVAAASLRRGLSCAEEVEDAAAFAAQVIRPTATDLLTAGLPVSSPQQLAAQWDENDVAEVVIVAEPEAAAVGSLHPRGSLFEKPVNSDLAKAQHAKLREVCVCACVRAVWGRACCILSHPTGTRALTHDHHLNPNLQSCAREKSGAGGARRACTDRA
jgi:hypothetical protein